MADENPATSDGERISDSSFVAQPVIGIHPGIVRKEGPSSHLWLPGHGGHGLGSESTKDWDDQSFKSEASSFNNSNSSTQDPSPSRDPGRTVLGVASPAKIRRGAREESASTDHIQEGVTPATSHGFMAQITQGIMSTPERLRNAMAGIRHPSQRRESAAKGMKNASFDGKSDPKKETRRERRERRNLRRLGNQELSGFAARATLSEELRQAAIEGNTEEVLAVFDEIEGSGAHDMGIADDADAYGVTALMLACMYGHNDVTIALLEHEVAVDLRDRKGQTALMLAVAERSVTQVKLLIDARANLHSGCTKEGGTTAVMLAAAGGDLELCAALMAPPCAYGHRMMAINRAPDVVKALEARDVAGRNAIDHAELREQTEIAAMLKTALKEAKRLDAERKAKEKKELADLKSLFGSAPEAPDRTQPKPAGKPKKQAGSPAKKKSKPTKPRKYSIFGNRSEC